MKPPAGFLFRKPNGIPCTVYLPRDAEPVGTIAFLHGRGECGTDSTRSLLVGLPNWLMRQPERWPFAVVIPQKPDETKPWHDYQEQVMEHLDAAISEHGLDEGRVALTGLSQGGNGAFRIGALAPERFRAVVPVCGFADFNFRNPTNRDQIIAGIADNLWQMPMRIYHGEADDVVPVQESIDIHAALQQRGSTSLLETYPGVNHNAWDKAYGESDLAEWLAGLF